MNEGLLKAYRWNRAHYVGNVYPRKRDYICLNSAVESLANARRDLANGKTRYPASYGWNPPFAAYGSTAMRWIEKPAACGLRFVGYADEIVSLRHRGWYVDNDQSETVRGVVFQLPGRNGKPLFIAGYEDWNNGSADNGGPVCLDFNDIIEGDATAWETVPGPGKERYGYWAYESNPADHYGAKTAARRADSIAERCAESEREYQAAWQAGSHFAALGKEIAAERKAALVLFAERRQWRGLEHKSQYPAFCTMLKREINRAAESIAELRRERDKLRSGDFVSEWLPGFSARDKRLRDAFNEGAGETIGT